MATGLLATQLNSLISPGLVLGVFESLVKMKRNQRELTHFWFLQYASFIRCFYPKCLKSYTRKQLGVSVIIYMQQADVEITLVLALISLRAQLRHCSYCVANSFKLVTEKLQLS